MKYAKSNGLEKVVPNLRPYVRKEPREYIGVIGRGCTMVSVIPAWIAGLAEHFTPQEMQRLLGRARRNQRHEDELRAAAESGEIGFIQQMWL